MIIDLILDRKQGTEYNAKEFYTNVTLYGDVGVQIATALDSGTDIDVKKELARYIIDGDYNLDIIEYINSVEWLTN